MPVYDYVCSVCGHRFEVFRGRNEAGPGQCPLCRGPVIRAFAPPTIVFRGSGWAKKDRRAAATPTKGAPAGPSKGGEAPADTTGPGAPESGTAASGASSEGESASPGAAPTSGGNPR